MEEAIALLEQARVQAEGESARKHVDRRYNLSAGMSWTVETNRCLKKAVTSRRVVSG
jgi:hypothetical protein